MSLIVFVSTDAGIVVVGDRASTGIHAEIGASADFAGGAVSSSSKIFAFDGNTIFGLTGMPEISFVLEDGTVSPAFNAEMLIMRYGRSHPYRPDDDAFWDEMVDAIGTELMTKAPPGQAFQPPADGFLFQAMFAHVPPDDSKWSYRCLRFFAEGHGEATRLRTELVPHPMPGVCVIGNRVVFDEIEQGTDARFDDVRRDPTIVLPRNVKFTPASAVAWAKRICAVTNERRALLEAVDTGHNVSAETDGWLVSASGWQRLHKNER